MNYCHFEILSNPVKVDSISARKAEGGGAWRYVIPPGKEYRPPWGWELHNYGTGEERALNGARAAISAFSHLSQGRMGTALEQYTGGTSRTQKKHVISLFKMHLKERNYKLYLTGCQK